MRKLVAEQPNITLAEIKAVLAKEKVTVGQSSISRFLHHLNLRRVLKKSLRAAEQDRPDVAAARKALQKQQPRLDPERLVFIDETSVSTTITRLYGRAPQGERLVQKVPHGNWKTITFIAALRHDRITAPFVLEGPMTGEMFKAYIEQFLAPTLTRGDFVFMDNVSVHKVDGIEEAIEARGAIPFYLPAYSPEPGRAPVDTRPAEVPEEPQHPSANHLAELGAPFGSMPVSFSRTFCPSCRTTHTNGSPEARGSAIPLPRIVTRFARGRSLRAEPQARHTIRPTHPSSRYIVGDVYYVFGLGFVFTAIVVIVVP